MRHLAVHCFLCIIALFLILSHSQSFAFTTDDYSVWQAAIAADGLAEASVDWSTVSYGNPVDFLVGPVQFQNADARPSFLWVPSPGVTPSIYGVGIYYQGDSGAQEFLANYWGAPPSDSVFFEAYERQVYSFHVPYSPDDVPIPEPGTLLLLSTGLAGLAGYGYRFRRKRKA